MTDAPAAQRPRPIVQQAAAQLLWAVGTPGSQSHGQTHGQTQTRVPHQSTYQSPHQSPNQMCLAAAIGSNHEAIDVDPQRIRAIPSRAAHPPSLCPQGHAHIAAH